MKYLDGTLAKNGDIIRWNCWDSDDFKTWTFTGMFTPRGVIYLGGGIDFGLGIGKVLSTQEVIDESENNDSYDVGIERVGSAFGLAKLIKGFNERG